MNIFYFLGFMALGALAILFVGSIVHGVLILFGY
jgi:hypothetical protein